MLALYISLLDTEEQISKFEHIYTKYRGLMFYTAKGVLQDSYLAEDAVHETFLDIIRIIDSIRANNEKELSQFLRVMTHHKSVDMVRRCNRQRNICDVTNLFQDATLSPAYLPLKLPKGFSTYPM